VTAAVNGVVHAHAIDHEQYAVGFKPSQNRRPSALLALLNEDGSGGPKQLRSRLGHFQLNHRFGRLFSHHIDAGKRNRFRTRHALNHHLRLVEADHVFHHTHLLWNSLSRVDDHVHESNRPQQQGVHLNIALNGRVARLIGHHLDTGVFIDDDRIWHRSGTVRGNRLDLLWLRRCRLLRGGFLCVEHA